LAKRKRGNRKPLEKSRDIININRIIMKPTQIKKSILSLNKKSIANLSDSEMNQINGGVATNPSKIIETLIDCPCTHFCQTDTK
jgi:hypothetical protein